MRTWWWMNGQRYVWKWSEWMIRSQAAGRKPHNNNRAQLHPCSSSNSRQLHSIGLECRRTPASHFHTAARFGALEKKVHRYSDTQTQGPGKGERGAEEGSKKEAWTQSCGLDSVVRSGLLLASYLLLMHTCKNVLYEHSVAISVSWTNFWTTSGVMEGASVWRSRLGILPTSGRMCFAWTEIPSRSIYGTKEVFLVKVRLSSREKHISWNVPYSFKLIKDARVLLCSILCC